MSKLGNRSIVVDNRKTTKKPSFCDSNE